MNRKLFLECEDEGDEEDKEDKAEGNEEEKNISYRKKKILETIYEKNDNLQLSFLNTLMKFKNRIKLSWILVVISMFMGYVAVSCHQHVLNLLTEKNTDLKISHWETIVGGLTSYLKFNRKKFPSQNNDLWYSIVAGFKGLTNEPVEPAVYLLVHYEDALQPSSCLVEVITNAANKYLLKNDRWLLVNGTKLSQARSRDPGILIEKLKDKIKFARIVVVTDLQEIPALLAQAFHFLVDQYDPVVQEIIYIMTMSVKTNFSISETSEVIENTLKNSWNELNNDVLQALITRVANHVLPVIKESEIEKCNLKVDSTIEIMIP